MHAKLPVLAALCYVQQNHLGTDSAMSVKVGSGDLAACFLRVPMLGLLSNNQAKGKPLFWGSLTQTRPFACAVAQAARLSGSSAPGLQQFLMECHEAAGKGGRPIVFVHLGQLPTLSCQAMVGCKGTALHC